MRGKSDAPIVNLSRAKSWFEVLQTAERSQSAVMTLAAGESTGEKAEAHRTSEQVLVVLEGEIAGEIGGDPVKMRTYDVVIIPAGVKHRFTNPSKKRAVTFNVYAPPEY
jgi:mannose-6-phosphate isomerase-like protein (cupin superfamily)